jgi:hypothetical protein
MGEIVELGDDDPQVLATLRVLTARVQLHCVGARQLSRDHAETLLLQRLMN